MALTPKAFKPVPKRFHPPGMPILYEDHDLLVVDKPSGLLTVTYDAEVSDLPTAYEILGRYVLYGNPKSHNKVFMVHRLDRDTSGVLVFAKHEAARAYLIEEWPSFFKTYQAVVAGIPPEKDGVIESYLAEDSSYKMYSVSDPEKGVFASTGFTVLKTGAQRALLELQLHTGKKNQIRVHLSEKGFPVLGDRKYGDKSRGIKRLALHAASLTLKHPHTHQPMTFSSKVPDYFGTLLRG